MHTGERLLTSNPLFGDVPDSSAVKSTCELRSMQRRLSDASESGVPELQA